MFDIENIHNNRKRTADGMRIEQDYTGTSEASADTPNDENVPLSTIPPPPAPPLPLTNFSYRGQAVKMAIMPNYPEDYNYCPVDHDGHSYVGLVNQAMTCYLNSLIQTLFMTPEFRNVLYEWQYNGTVEEAAKSIPFQLQKLFALLQTTQKNSLETKDLTASFGWEGNDAYEQHDVQELSRVMLEALEHRFRKSEQHRTFIQNLYKGTMEDVVKCLGCKRENVRQDIYNDLALAIREFGATESYKSIEEALTAFIKPELLTGNNKYKCESCNSYQEAEKGFRFTAFPYLLAIQLKRFTLDYATGYRVKLNDRMGFPDYLDLNSYIYNPDGKTAPKPSKLSYAAMANRKPATINEEEEMTTSSLSGDADGWLYKPPTCEEVQNMLKNGKYVYELFAVLIHQGSATGGHYFAYVKNLEQSKWLCFNDMNVKGVDADEIKKCFGGTGWCNNMNAYMMVYRQIDAEKNQKFTRRVELPPHVTNWLKQWEDDENRQAVEKTRIDSMVKIRVLLNDERNLTDDSPYGAYDCSFSRDDTFSDVIDYFAEKFTEMGIFVDPKLAILLPARGTFNFSDPNPVDPKSTIADLIAANYSSCPELCFVMELKREDWDLPQSGEGCFFRTLDFLTVDVSFNTVRMCKRIAAYDVETLGSLRQRVAKLFPKCAAGETDIRMVMDVVFEECSPLILIGDDSETLGHLVGNKFQIPKFYIDCGLPANLKADREIADFASSQMCKIIEKRKYGTRIRIQLPSAADYRQAGFRPPSNLLMHSTDAGGNESPPVSPISKKFCQLGPLNETCVVTTTAASTSSINTRISNSGSLYTCAENPTVVVSSPACSSFDKMDRFANSLAYDNPSDRGHPSSPVEGFFAEGPVYPHQEGYAPLSERPMLSDAALSDDDMEIDCPASAGASPNVSDNEGNYPDRNGSHMDGNLPMLDPNPWKPVMSTSSFAPTDLYSDAYEFPEYTVDVLETGTSEMFFCKYVTVLIDHRQLTTKLVEWIARYLKLHPDNVALAKHYNDTDIKGYDITLYPDETIKVSFASVNRITVTLRVPTAEDERLIRVVEFDLNNENITDQWPILFSLPASQTTTFREFRDKCLEILDSAYAEKYLPERVRLREVANFGCPAVDLDLTFEDRFPKDQMIALQKLKMEEVHKPNDGRKYQPMIVRRFCPSTLEIMPPFEVMLPDNDPKNPQILKHAIAARTNLVAERIGLSDLLPKGNFSRWPYTKSALDLLDTSFADSVVLPIEYGGKLVYFVDKNEPKKHITEDDRRTMRIRERISSNSTARRTERPLRIQMSSISESDQ